MLNVDNVLNFNGKPHILLVEDNPLIQKIHIKFLELLGCQIDVASNGKEAIDLSQGNYDLIFMDIGLPDMDGIQTTANIRNQINNKNIPIIALTSLGDLVTDECKEAGINAVATKPISINHLNSILHYWLSETLKK